MRTLKTLSRRSLALLLTLVMMTGMVNLSAFAADEPQQDWDESFQLPNPQEVAMQIEALNQEIEELDPEAADYEAQLAQLQEQLAMLEMLQYPMEDGVLLAMDGRGYEISVSCCWLSTPKTASAPLLRAACGLPKASGKRTAPTC